MKQIIFINSHPIQYFAPMYKYMNKEGVDTICWYCSNPSAKGKVDKEFGVKIKWDIPIFEGYKYKIFKNHTWVNKSGEGFWSLINIGMIGEIFKIPKSIIVVHGWHYFTHLSIILLAKLAGHTVCLRNETPQKHENVKKGIKQVFKVFFLKKILFPRVDYFLYIGKQNRLFYENLFVTDNQLICCPYVVDNDRFRNFVPDRKTFKQGIGISANQKVIVFSGKYIPKKRPLDILEAFCNIKRKDCWLVMIGEGELRNKMESFIKKEKLDNIILTGFINQSQIASYYAIGDVFVMCSSVGETWGLSVNEAMNFDLPLVLSDLTGCADDLVIDGVNGYVYPTGDVEALTERLEDVLYRNKLSWKPSSRQIIDKYSYTQVVKNIKSIL